jgi:hypothetical protein
MFCETGTNVAGVGAERPKTRANCKATQWGRELTLAGSVRNTAGG